MYLFGASGRRRRALGAFFGLLPFEMGSLGYGGRGSRCMKLIL